ERPWAAGGGGRPRPWLAAAPGDQWAHGMSEPHERGSLSGAIPPNVGHERLGADLDPLPVLKQIGAQDLQIWFGRRGWACSRDRAGAGGGLIVVLFLLETGIRQVPDGDRESDRFHHFLDGVEAVDAEPVAEQVPARVLAALNADVDHDE